MKRLIGLTGMAAVLLARSALAAVELREFPAYKDLEPPPTRTSGIASVTLDPEIRRFSEDVFANMRLLDQNKQETPFCVRKKVPTKSVVRENAFELETLSLRQLPENRIEIIVKRAPQKPVPVAVRFHSPMKDFEKQVTVSGSADQQEWKALVKEEPIFDYSRFLDVRRDRVNFDPRDFAFYRIEIANIMENKDSPLVEITRRMGGNVEASQTEASSYRKETFRIDRISFIEKKESVVEGDVETRDSAVAQWGMPERQPPKKSIYFFNADRRPVVALILRIRDPNFSRAVIIEGSNSEGNKDWREITTGRISWIEASRVHQQNLVLPLPGECRCLQYRITILDQDSPPLPLNGIDVRENLYEACFLPQGGNTYRLYYGAKGLAAPQYDMAAVIARSQSARPDPWRLGAEAQNPEFKPKFLPKSSTAKKLFIGTSISMAVILVLIILLMIKKAEPQPTAAEETKPEK